MREEAISGKVYHHATAEAIREGLTYHMSIDGEPLVVQMARSLAEDLQMHDEPDEVEEILRRVELNQHEIEEMIAEGVAKLAARTAVRVQRLEPEALPMDCRATLATLRERAWQKATDDAADTHNGQLPPSHLRDQLGAGAWDGFQPAEITGREAIEIHDRTPGSLLMVRTPDGPEPISIDAAWDAIRQDPGSVFVKQPTVGSFSGRPNRVGIVAVKPENVDAAVETIRAAAREPKPADVRQFRMHDSVGLEVSADVPEADVERARTACAKYPDAVCPE